MAFTVKPVSPSVALEVEDFSPPPDGVFAEDMVVIRPVQSTGCAMLNPEPIRVIKPLISMYNVQQRSRAELETAVAICSPKNNLTTFPLEYSMVALNFPQVVEVWRITPRAPGLRQRME